MISIIGLADLSIHEALNGLFTYLLFPPQINKEKILNEEKVDAEFIIMQAVINN